MWKILIIKNIIKLIYKNNLPKLDCLLALKKLNLKWFLISVCNTKFI
jgi:hypothetical protein